MESAIGRKLTNQWWTIGRKPPKISTNFQKSTNWNKFKGIQTNSRNFERKFEKGEKSQEKSDEYLQIRTQKTN